MPTCRSSSLVLLSFSISASPFSFDGPEKWLKWEVYLRNTFIHIQYSACGLEIWCGGGVGLPYCVLPFLPAVRPK
uniref:Uncharacterized protein n=1 Tax=Anguilla anguilla TaxID=7936 RepID=A0A0E9T8V1_ANGAN